MPPLLFVEVVSLGFVKPIFVGLMSYANELSMNMSLCRDPGISVPWNPDLSEILVLASFLQTDFALPKDNPCLDGPREAYYAQMAASQGLRLDKPLTSQARKVRSVKVA